MRLFCNFFLLFVSVISFGQQTKEFAVTLVKNKDANTKKEIFIGSNIYQNEDLIPIYHDEEYISESNIKKGYSIDVLSKEILKISDLGAILPEDLPNDPQLNLEISRLHGKPILNIEFYPIYKEGNTYYKIGEAQVNYELENIQASKVSSIQKISAITNSVLSSGTWYKIGVDKTGVFKIDSNFLSNLGINTSGLNPNHIKIYGSGGAILSEEIDEGDKNGLIENAIFVEGSDDGAFNTEDYILFYAQGPISWDLTSRDQIDHLQNYYSDRGYYFINVDSGTNGKRINQKSSINETTTIEVSTFTDYRLHEQELINYVGTGKQWFGEDYSINSTQNYEFEFSNIVDTENVIIETNYSANSSLSTSYTMSYGSGVQTTNIGSVSSSSKNGFNQGSQSISFLPKDDSVALQITFNNNGDVSAQAHLDYLKVIADRYLEANGEQYGFLNFDSANSNEVLNYSIENNSNIDFIWNVTDINNPEEIINQSTNSDQFSFKEITDGVINKYQLIDISNTYSPINLGDDSIVQNQNLQALQDVDYLIVTHESLFSQANRLADYHRTNTLDSNDSSTTINVEVVDIEKVYNEFGSGAPDISAVRNFIKYLYDNASTDEDKIKYVCFFGDASYDYKGITHDNDINIFTFSSLNSLSLVSSYNSDDFYGYMDDVNLINTSGNINISGKLEVATGRIPVKNAAEATTVVDKILKYYSSDSFGSWKNIVTLLGDDGQEGESQELIEILEGEQISDNEAEGFAANIELLNENFNISKLYTDAFVETVTAGGGAYPEVKSRFLDAFDNGSLVINYFGHGNSSAIGEENYLDISDIRAIRNLNNLPLFITVTCDFSRFDNHNIVSGGEELVLQSLGGVSSMITTSRQITITAGEIINNALGELLFIEDDTKTIGEVLKEAKNNSSTNDKYFVYFFGDPAMRLSIPTKGVKINNIRKYVSVKDSDEEVLENENISTIQGLSKVNISGGVYDNDILVDDFNGELEVVLYGEEIDRSTLLNEEGGVTEDNLDNVVNYGSLENKFFTGAATVVNGVFSFDFILPKDVSVLPEEAKFSFYASSTSIERTGSDFSYQVGGVDPDVEEDTTPPIVSLFLDDTTFIDGGEATTTPELIVKIEDENGINTSLNSIGHDISLVLDGDTSNPISLNDFYTTEKDDFTQGLVTYELDELEVGNHVLTVKAWDTHNNSSIQTLNFVVVEDVGFKISNVLNYPNPFINHTEFWFQTNRVNNLLEIKVQVYTVSGKLIKTVFGADVNTNSDLTGVVRSVTWDGKDDFGNKLAKGVYLYRITVKDVTTGETDKKLEKLVIL